MKKSDMYNKIATTNNWEVITSKEAKKLVNNRFLSWFDRSDDQIEIGISLKGEETIYRTYRVA